MIKEGHAITQGIGDYAAYERAEHDSHDHGCLKDTHRPRQLLLWRHIHDKRHADGDKAAGHALDHAKDQKLYGRSREIHQSNDHTQDEEDHRQRKTRTPAIGLHGPERRRDRDEEGRHTRNQPCPKRRFSRVRDAQLRCKKERNEGNDANDRDPCPDLYRCHGIHDSFPILHSINAS